MSTLKNPTFTFDLTQIQVVPFHDYEGVLPLNMATSRKERMGK
jgi:hypothetical protein